MSYADAALDLTPVSVACLTGLNGSGKSALLEAVTWALWEEARAPSDELVRLGQAEMWVNLCFTLENQVYRVRRARQKAYGRSGQQTGSRGNLDLQVFEGSEAEWLDAVLQIGDAPPVLKWRSLTAPSMRETQKRLKELLRMDYETFITSVYLRQGRADEFTMRSPNERKQVLSDILGLDYFDRLQEICRDRARECKGRIQVLEANLASRSDFEQGYKDSCADIERLAAQLEESLKDLENCALQQSELESQIATLNYLQIRSETARARSLELAADSQSLERRSVELREQEKKLLELVAESESVLEQFRQFEECKAVVESMDNKASRHSELSNRRLELRGRLAMCQGRMEVELEHLESAFKTRQERRDALAKSCNDRDKIESAYNEYRRLLDAELEMSRKREAFTALSARADELQAMISESRVRLEAQTQQKEVLLAELEQLLSVRGEIEQEQDLLRQELAAIDRLEAEFALVEEKGIKVKSQIESMQQQIAQLRKHIRENQEKMQELRQTPDLSNCPLCRSPIVDGKAVFDRYDEDNEASRIEIENLENQIAVLTDERDALRKQYVELHRKLEQRKRLDMRIGEFNERKAAIERAEASRGDLRREVELAGEMLANNTFAPVEKESLVRVKAELVRLEFDPIVFSSFQAQMRSQRHVEMRWQQLQKDLKELAELEAELPLAKERIARMKDDLQTGNFGPDDKAEIEKLDAQLAELAYDKFAHQEQKQRLVSLFGCAEKARDLQKAAQELPELRRASGEISQMLLLRQQELERLEQEALEWSCRLDELPSLKDELERVGLRQQQLESEKGELSKRHLLLQNKLEQLEQDRSDLDTRKKILADNIKEMSEYGQLAEAFGKKGLQAIIIENAIPEIEAEANRILSRLTDNCMHLGLLSQQRTRQGHPVETLEIIIADELGTRSYELYSGGEAFRVDFALRVAMSRLLARRAGAKLETLIIDEGFGSQDELSRAKLIQAIASIKSDFARIIVVTHISEVKDMFPVQLAVSKAEGVSQVALLA
jgi:DNA repair protein SbcC/Rad50